jgi:LmbE family N-acetylglucosaminyl deacetylase
MRDFFPELLEEGLEPHRPREAYFSGRGPDLNVWIDIAETFEAKLRALACHKSQIPDISEIEPSLRKWSREMGKAKGIECAECYRKLEVPE